MFVTGEKTGCKAIDNILEEVSVVTQRINTDEHIQNGAV